MKAVRVHEYGGPEVLRYEDVDEPVPGPGDALVRMQYIGLNFSDTKYRQGLYPGQASSLPIIPGHEGVGEVLAVGDGVTEATPGDTVVFAGQHRIGTYREVIALPAISCIPVPSGMDPKLAVATLNQGQTAHYLVHDAHPIEPGERVLIHAGAGGVGSNLIQMAKQLGATVFTTVSTEEKAEFARDLGADEVILYTETDFVEEIRRLTDGEGVDAVFDAVGGDTTPRSARCLAPRGHLVTYGRTAGPPPPMEWPDWGPRSFYLSTHTGGDSNHPGPQAIGRAHEIFRWVNEGALKVHIHHESPLAEAQQAHEDIESRGTTGKLILVP